jgi:hypothetical protein
MYILSDFIPIFVSYLPVRSVLVSFFLSVLFCYTPSVCTFCLFFFGGGGGCYFLCLFLSLFRFIFPPFSISFPFLSYFKFFSLRPSFCYPVVILAIFLPNAKRQDAVRNIGPPRFIKHGIELQGFWHFGPQLLKMRVPVFVERSDKTMRETLTVITEISQEQKLRCWPQRHLSGHICGMN